MRLPAEAQLTDEQREICFAPARGTSLVIGPPGSGKTVVAYFRAERLRRKGDAVELVMFNHVLKRYTGNGETFLTWIAEWWQGTTGKRLPWRLVKDDDTGRRRREWDFRVAMEQAQGDLGSRIMDRGHWGHLILDEAQDFSRDAHRFLFVLQKIVFKEGSPPSILVLADENQRINEQNSTLAELADAYMLGESEVYELTRNYRNTREIALLAQAFYVGLPSGVPKLPEARGEKPSLIVTEDLDQAVDRIANYARLNPQEEIGVLVYYDRTRRKVFNKLDYRLEKDPLDVQTYTSRDSAMAEDLLFDGGGVVTVLCFASSKGLEFDAVFLPELQTMPVDAEHRDIARMQLYVMISRARSRLFLLASDQGRAASVWGLLPLDEDLIELE